MHIHNRICQTSDLVQKKKRRKEERKITSAAEIINSRVCPIFPPLKDDSRKFLRREVYSLPIRKYQSFTDNLFFFFLSKSARRNTYVIQIAIRACAPLSKSRTAKCTPTRFTLFPPVKSFSRLCSTNWVTTMTLSFHPQTLIGMRVHGFAARETDAREHTYLD